MVRSPSRRTTPFGDRFTLFAECLLVGVLVTVAMVPLITVLPAFAAGCAHLRAHLDEEDTSIRAWGERFRAALRGSWMVSLAGLGVLLLFWLDLAISQAGLPGGNLVAAVCGLGILALVVVGSRAAATWRPGADWRGLVRQAAHRATSDLSGSLLVVFGLFIVVVVTWQLPVLLIPALGCLALALVAVERRAGVS